MLGILTTGERDLMPYTPCWYSNKVTNERPENGKAPIMTIARSSPPTGVASDMPRSTRLLQRPSVNITPAERWGRMLIGLIGVVAGVVLLVQGGSTVVIVFDALLVVAAFDLLITGMLGHCPLYSKLGHVPASLKRSP